MVAGMVAGWQVAAAVAVMNKGLKPTLRTLLAGRSQHCLQAESVDALLRGVCGCAGSGIIGSVES